MEVVDRLVIDIAAFHAKDDALVKVVPASAVLHAPISVVIAMVTAHPIVLVPPNARKTNKSILLPTAGELPG